MRFIQVMNFPQSRPQFFIIYSHTIFEIAGPAAIIKAELHTAVEPFDDTFLYTGSFHETNIITGR